MFFSFLCVLAFLSTPLLQTMAFELTLRHYIEGMILSVLAIFSILQFNDTAKRRWLLISCFFFALATTTKETYLPLPGVLFFAINGPLSHRVKAIAPFAVVTSAYLIWRYSMLGSFGGYHLGMTTNWSTVGDVFWNSLPYSVGSGGLFLIFVAMVGMTLAYLWRQLDWLGRVGIVAIASFVMLPLLSLTPTISSMKMMSPYWLSVPIAFGIVAIAAYSNRLPVQMKYICILGLAAMIITNAILPKYEQHEVFRGAGAKVTQILHNDKGPHVLEWHMSSSLAQNALAEWAVLGYLHNGNWNVQMIFQPWQTLFHDFGNKPSVIIWTNKKKESWITQRQAGKKEMCCKQ